jgi:hypothetical protein
MAKKLLATATMALTVVILVTGCTLFNMDSDGSDTFLGNGGERFSDKNGTITLNRGKWLMNSNMPERRGTYTISGGGITLKITHRYFPFAGGWVTQKEAEDHPDSGGMSFDEQFATLFGTKSDTAIEVKINNGLRIFTKE